MFDKVKRRLMLMLFTDLSVLIPAMLGLTGGIGMWATESSNVMGKLGVFSMFLVSTGMFFTKLFSDYDGVVDRAKKSLNKERTEAEDKQLNDLYEKVKSNQEEKQIWADLCSYRSAFSQGLIDGDMSTLVELRASVNQLIDESFKFLEKANSLRKLSYEVSSKIKPNVLAKRLQILETINSSIKQLEKIATEINSLEISPDKEYSTIQSQVSDSLETVKRVHEVMSSWEDDTLTELRNMKDKESIKDV